MHDHSVLILSQSCLKLSARKRVMVRRIFHHIHDIVDNIFGLGYLGSR